MHGSSSVPQEWLDVIREFGGEIKETYGVPVEQIQEGIRNGVRKVNIDTDIRLAMTGGHAQKHGEKRSRIRPAQVPEGCHRRSTGHLPGPVRSVRVRWTGVQDQADHTR